MGLSCLQEAPELNEQNFPSLSATADESAPAAAPAAKAGFAAAVKSSSPAQPPAQPVNHTANGHARPAGKAEPVPWLETGRCLIIRIALKTLTHT